MSWKQASIILHISTFYVAILWLPHAYAETDVQPPVSRSITEKQTQSPKTTDIFESSHQYLSEGFEEGVKLLDMYFAEEQYYKKDTSSHIQILSSIVANQYGEIGYAGNISINLDLPKTQERLRFLIESNAVEQLEQDPVRTIYKTPQEAAQESDIYTSILAPISEGETWNLHASLGMRFSTPLDPFILFRLKYFTPIQNWYFRFTENLVIYDSIGTISSGIIELDRELGPSTSFRSISSATWKYETDKKEYAQDFILFQRLDSDRLVAFQIGEYGTLSTTAMVEKYIFNIRYRHNIYKDWLYMEVKPEILYALDKNFTPEYSVTLQLEMLFGARYVKRK